MVRFILRTAFLVRYLADFFNRPTYNITLTKAKETLIGNECEISDNRVIITPTLQMTACSGLLRGIIECQFESGNIRFFGINFDIMRAPEKAEIESTDEFTVLDKHLQRSGNCLQRQKTENSTAQTVLTVRTVSG